jgi:hypothetical protein
MLATTTVPMRLKTITGEVILVAGTFQNDVPSLATISAVGSSKSFILFTTKTYAASAAISRLQLYFGLVDEHDAEPIGHLLHNATPA